MARSTCVPGRVAGCDDAAGGRTIDAGRRLTEVAASVAAPDGWGEVGVAMLRSELALHDGELGAAELTALNALTVAVRQDLRPWLCDVIEQIAFVDAAAGRRPCCRARACRRSRTSGHWLQLSSTSPPGELAGAPGPAR